MKRARGIGSVLAITIPIWIGAFCWPRHAPRAGGVMPQQAYVWQRNWTPELDAAVRASVNDLAGCVVLGAEVSFRSGRLEVARIRPDYSLFKSTSIPPGIALRIGPYRGPFAANDAIADQLMDLAASLIAEATAAGVRPAELQIDFDASESKLDGYRLWVEAIRRRISRTPLTITALPSWLRHREFGRLAQSAGGYVLQVHSLRRPRSVDSPVTLCDVAEARAAAERAGGIGVPFRVALPTYGYLVAFNEGGQFIGLSAEAPSESWPAGVRVRTLRADPAAMAELVRGWTIDRPRGLIGIIWYRLPIPQDALNWRWATLKAVIAGRAPSPDLHVKVRRSEPCLCDVELVNAGDADARLDREVVLRWKGATLTAADALSGFEPSAASDYVTIRPSAALADAVLPPGESRRIGWVRLTDNKEVQADVIPAAP